MIKCGMCHAALPQTQKTVWMSLFFCCSASVGITFAENCPSYATYTPGAPDRLVLSDDGGMKSKLTYVGGSSMYSEGPNAYKLVVSIIQDPDKDGNSKTLRCSYRASGSGSEQHWWSTHVSIIKPKKEDGSRWQELKTGVYLCHETPCTFELKK